ncbi:hypothetical protein ACFLZX_00170 [Nanoarchaeota archaeon]
MGLKLDPDEIERVMAVARELRNYYSSLARGSLPESYDAFLEQLAAISNTEPGEDNSTFDMVRFSRERGAVRRLEDYLDVARQVTPAENVDYQNIVGKQILMLE